MSNTISSACYISSDIWLPSLMETVKLIHPLILISSKKRDKSLQIAQGGANQPKGEVKDCDPDGQSGNVWSIKAKRTAYNFSGQCRFEIRIPSEPCQHAFVPEEKQSGKNNNSLGKKTESKKQGHKQQAQQRRENTCSSFSANCFTSIRPSISTST